MLEARELTKTVNSRDILTDVSLSVNPGEAVVLVGPSGSGKTTVLRLMAGLDDSYKGQTLLDGQQMREMPREDLWPSVTLVFQQLFLWPHLTLWENVTLAMDKDSMDACRDQVDVLCARLGLDGLMAHYPNELSLGEKQRAALTRALLVRPRYLLLDEVTSALDVESAQEVVALLGECKTEERVGLLIVTHHLGLARRLADRVVFLDRGTVVESGGVEILERPGTPRLERFLSIT